MRNFIISLISIIIILCLWSGFTLYSATMSDALQAQARTLIFAYIEKEDWVSAEDNYKEMEKLWDRYKKTASIFFDSKDINEIDSTMDKAHLYMEAKDVSNSTGEFSYLMDKFRFIHQNDTVTFANIF